MKREDYGEYEEEGYEDWSEDEQYKRKIHFKNKFPKEWYKGDMKW